MSLRIRIILFWIIAIPLLVITYIYQYPPLLYHLSLLVLFLRLLVIKDMSNPPKPILVIALTSVGLLVFAILLNFLFIHTDYKNIITNIIYVTGGLAILSVVIALLSSDVRLLKSK